MFTIAITAARLPSGRGKLLDIQVRTTMKQHWAPMAMRNMAKKRAPRTVIVMHIMYPTMVKAMGTTICIVLSFSLEVEKDVKRQAMKVATHTGQVRRRAEKA